MISPVLFAEPPNPRNLAAIGYDVMSDPVRRDMVERARDTGRPAASARIQLVQEIDANKQAGFLVAMPVYAGGAVPPDLEDRRRRFLGFVFGAFRADDLFNSIVAAEAEEDAAFAIYDGAPSEANLLHRSARVPAAGAGRLTREAHLELGGRTWTVAFAQRVSPRRGSALPEIWLVCGGGLFATALLALAAYRQRRTQDEIRQLNASLEARVEERTRDLRRRPTVCGRPGRSGRAWRRRCASRRRWRRWASSPAGWRTTSTTCWRASRARWSSSRPASPRAGRRMSASTSPPPRGPPGGAAALTHRLLAFSRRQTLAPKAIDADRLVRGMLDLIQRTVGPSVEVRHVGADGLWTVLADPSQLENALLNLCINARDAMPEGGRITIETDNC